MINSTSRYLDTAAVSLAAKEGSCLSAAPPWSASPAEPLGKVLLPDGLTTFYASNATLVMLSIVEQRVLYGGYGWKGDSTSNRLHPVVRNALRPLQQRAAAGNAVHIRTLTDWITGERCDPDLIAALDIAASDLLIVDCVQSFGTLAFAELEKLLECANRGVIIVGCLHKWLGSPVPLGFAILSTRLLERDAGLRDHLAARDYLGWSLGPREGFNRFPDTYAATLSSLFSPLLRIAFGLDRAALERVRRMITRNRDLLAKTVCQSKQLGIVESVGECRAIVAAHAPTTTAETISARLVEAGFIHTLFRDLPVPGQATLRLSAPLVELDSGSQRLLESILVCAS